MNKLVSVLISVSCAFFLASFSSICLFCPIFMCQFFILSYFIILSFLTKLVCFLIGDRNRVESDGRSGGEELKGVEGG